MNPFSKFQKRSMVIPSTSFASYVISDGKILPNKLVSAQTALKNSDIFAIVNLISSDVASSKIIIQEPYGTLMKRPNNLVSGFNFWQSVVAQLLLSGNSYVALNRRNDNIVQRMMIAPPDSVSVILADASADISYQVNWQDERQIQSYSSADMLHFRLLSVGSNDTDTYIGISPLQSLAASVNMQDFAQHLTLSSLKHALNPAVVLTAPEGVLSKEEKEGIRKGWENANEGKNAGRAIVLDQAVKLDTISINADVAKFLSTQDFGKTQIAKAFGVPDSYLNGKGDQQSSLDMTKSLYANTLRRYVRPLESEIEAKLNVSCNFDETAAVDADNSTLVGQINKLMAGTNPAITPEIAQQMLKERGVL
ncbi:phage portal protein [Lapidilactobacillus luobeiensis]|uniref:phage portal protein n=1 Tax=Lapidilactobacillus luobeiensis TaxID=2950371 RepID=UPI0021C35B52|nr:phage portal protein [Lapidilactobacillus luobeiensis]